MPGIWLMHGSYCRNHMLCFGHTMNLAVKKGTAVESLGNILSKYRKLVSHFNHSYLANVALKAKQMQLGLNKKSLKQDVDTR